MASVLTSATISKVKCQAPATYILCVCVCVRVCACLCVQGWGVLKFLAIFPTSDYSDAIACICAYKATYIQVGFVFSDPKLFCWSLFIRDQQMSLMTISET